jgi:CBS domain-containing protein
MTIKLRSIMSSPPITVTEADSLEAAARKMLDAGIGCLPVVGADGKIVGIVTESSFTARNKGVPFSTFRAPQLLGRWISGDGVEKIYEEARSTPVSEIMSKPVITVNEDDGVTRAVELMLKHDVNRLPVVRDGEPVGIVARHDLLRMMLSDLDAQE